MPGQATGRVIGTGLILPDSGRPEISAAKGQVDSGLTAMVQAVPV
ncbi:hypothetical protein NITLEN_110023 [Nitrospira lenta]|uniref:Uncharacterized protein n=2 Tax=Nitrospira lenta TaxID=1436998 RepID=A0A0K2GX52_9BACT|nr:hypothetical protein NITLEN_v1_110023 [Nitrospira lenta]SPP64257.1 hypothetical protein NITLEN_110023 [Nitrospira lenta]